MEWPETNFPSWLFFPVFGWDMTIKSKSNSYLPMCYQPNSSFFSLFLLEDMKMYSSCIYSTVCRKSVTPVAVCCVGNWKMLNLKLMSHCYYLFVKFSPNKSTLLGDLEQVSFITEMVGYFKRIGVIPIANLSDGRLSLLFQHETIQKYICVLSIISRNKLD